MQTETDLNVPVFMLKISPSCGVLMSHSPERHMIKNQRPVLLGKWSIDLSVCTACMSAGSVAQASHLSPARQHASKCLMWLVNIPLGIWGPRVKGDTSLAFQLRNTQHGIKIHTIHTHISGRILRSYTWPLLVCQSLTSLWAGCQQWAAVRHS